MIISRRTSVQSRGCLLYSEKVRAHYANPRNVGNLAEPSGRAIVKSPVDSDTVLITLRIEKGIVEEIKFKCMGCAVAIACSSMATEMVLGKTVDEAYALTEEAVAEALGGIPEYKMRCSNLAPQAIKQAIDDFRQCQQNGGKPEQA
jgi:nitrogen fixation NifU-like protein